MKNKINVLLFVSAVIVFIGFASKAEAVTYTLTDLGVTQTEEYESWFTGMNDVGQLVGYNDGYPSIWENGSWNDLGLLPGCDYGWANAINNSSVVVGTLTDENALGKYIHQYYVFMWDEENGMTDLGSFPNGKNSKEPDDINENNQVVGAALASNGEFHAFLWENDTLVDLNPYLFTDTRRSWAHAINDSGYIVGEAFIPDDPEISFDIGQTSAFLWKSDEEELVDLGSLGEAGAWAVDINDSGYITGGSVDKIGEYEYMYYAFIWHNGIMTDLGSFGGNETWTIDINNSNEVIGVAENDSEEYLPFVWDSTHGMRNIFSLLESNPGLLYLDLIALNNNGQILASGAIEGEEEGEHSFLLTPNYSGNGGGDDDDGDDSGGEGSENPIPEPVSLLLLGFGVLGIAVFKRRFI